MPQPVPYDLGPFATRDEAQQTCDQITFMGGICAVVERPAGFYVRVTKEPSDSGA